LKKKKFQNSNNPSTAPVIDETLLPPLYITLCHNCNFLNEGLSEVSVCRRCGTRLTLASYLDAMDTEQLADFLMEEETLEYEKRSAKIVGLSVIW